MGYTRHLAKTTAGHLMTAGKLQLVTFLPKMDQNHDRAKFNSTAFSCKPEKMHVPRKALNKMKAKTLQEMSEKKDLKYHTLNKKFFPGRNAPEEIRLEFLGGVSKCEGGGV
jgi:hypothetical protein